MNGILPLWKPKGMTSHDCVMKVRRLFQTRKVGHTGTLDPEVEGVLVICIGQATKVVSYLTEMDKTYVAECSLGKSTETEDAHGAMIEEKIIENLPSDQEVECVLEDFRGEITQIPPMYSAVRVNGRRLYEYARANEYVERPSRQVFIHELEKLTEKNKRTNTFTLKVTCSAGTYMRTLCVDIGKKLGYPAHMSHLIRTASCSFSGEDTVTFEEIQEAKENNDLENMILPIIESLRHFDSIHVDKSMKEKVLNGQKLGKPEKELSTEPFLMIHDEQLLAIYQTHPENPQEIKPVRVFNVG